MCWRAEGEEERKLTRLEEEVVESVVDVLGMLKEAEGLGEDMANGGDYQRRCMMAVCRRSSIRTGRAGRPSRGT